MTRAEILEKLQGVFREVFDDDGLEIGEGTEAADIEDWDSLMHITLLSAIERAFGFKFTIDQVVSLACAGDVVDLIESNA